MANPPREPITEHFRPQVIHLCQVCGNIARYPRPKSHTFRFPFGWTWTVQYVTPMVCMTCRMGRHHEARMTYGWRRRFWQRAIALYLGEDFPSMGPRMVRLMTWRRRWFPRRGGRVQ